MEMLLERRSSIFQEQEEHTKFIMSAKIVAKIAIDNMKKKHPTYKGDLTIYEINQKIRLSYDDRNTYKLYCLWF